jgi:hypothetical protein
MVAKLSNDPAGIADAATNRDVVAADNGEPVITTFTVYAPGPSAPTAAVTWNSVCLMICMLPPGSMKREMHGASLRLTCWSTRVTVIVRSATETPDRCTAWQPDPIQWPAMLTLTMSEAVG